MTAKIQKEVNLEQQNPVLHEIDNGNFILSGVINFDNVSNISYLGWQSISSSSSSSTCIIDCSQVRDVDSSALALIADWMRQAKAIKIDLKFTNIPESLKKLSQICGVEKLLFKHSNAS